MTVDKPRVLIVDDERLNLNVLVDLLKDDYRPIVAKDGLQALQRVTTETLPDLILLDVMMPGMDGYEVCRRLKQSERTRDIPVIFVSAMSDVADETRGFDLGAVDYITKPISPRIVKARVRTHLALKQASQLLQDQNRMLEQKVVERTRDLALTQDVMILGLASLAETRDNETGNHIRRTQFYVKVLAEHLGRSKPYALQLDPSVIDLLFKSAPLHDIGKVGIPDGILLKPGKLTDSEFTVMKRHTILGRDTIAYAEAALIGSQAANETTSFLRLAREIAYGHHEKWDGTGYPEGLSGQAIPLSSRLMAIADVYDALISRRVYKPPFPHERAVAIVLEGRGKHFDPEMVDAFDALQDDFRATALRFSDE
jgi:putative two-component system response regulator